MTGNAIYLNDPGYNVYLLYQKEVYSSDHSFLQSMMDWLYSSNDSPYKFIFRNRAFININHYGIILQKDRSMSTLTNGETESNWTNIHFNLKHLKEIYVDKRHKDTCVLVSKVSSSSSSSIYVWKKTNPSNYQTFRSPYALNNAIKKSYLLTIIKFKDGPARLLQSIQLLDRVLADFNIQDMNMKNSYLNNSNSTKSNAGVENIEKQQQRQKQQQQHNTDTNSKFLNSNGTPKSIRYKPNLQQYFDDYLSKKMKNPKNNGLTSNYAQLQLKQQTPLNRQVNPNLSVASETSIMYHNCASNSSNNIIINNSGHNSLKTTYTNSGCMINNNVVKHPRRLSVDNTNYYLKNFYQQDKFNNILYSTSNNGSTVSLQNYYINGNKTNEDHVTSHCQFINNNKIGLGSIPPSFSLSRHSSISNIIPHVPILFNRSLSTNNNNNLSKMNDNSPSYRKVQNNIVSNSVPASPAPKSSSFVNSYQQMYNNLRNTNNSQSSCLNPQCLHYNSNNPSMENLSEIGYQQYNKKFVQNKHVSKFSVSSATSLNTSDLNLLKSCMNSLSNTSFQQRLFDNCKNNNNKNHKKLFKLINKTNSPDDLKEIKESLNKIENNNKTQTQCLNAAESDKKKTSPQETNENFKSTSCSVDKEELRELSKTSNITEIKKNFLNSVSKANSTAYSSSFKLPKEKCNISAHQKEKSNEALELLTSSFKYDKRPEENSSLSKTNLETISNDVNSLQLKNLELNVNEKDKFDDEMEIVETTFFIEEFSLTKNKDESSKNEMCMFKETNKVRDIINTFNNFDKNFSSNGSNIIVNSLAKQQSQRVSPNSNTKAKNSKPSSGINSITKTNEAQEKPLKSKLENSFSSSSLFSKNIEMPKINLDFVNKIANKTEQSITKKNLFGIKSDFLSPINHENNKKKGRESPNSENKEKKTSKLSTSSLCVLSKADKTNSPSSNTNNDLVKNNSNNLSTECLSNAPNIKTNPTESTTNASDKNDTVSEKSATKSFPKSVKFNSNGEQKSQISIRKSSNPNFDSKPRQNECQESLKISTQVSQENQKAFSSIFTPRKRTFANMNWPMDPEEEKILRSSSPYIVPEVIVQRNDTVKGILKKNDSTNEICSKKQSQDQSSDIVSAKKKVDFSENFCLVNFFDTNGDGGIKSSVVKSKTGNEVFSISASEST